MARPFLRQPLEPFEHVPQHAQRGLEIGIGQVASDLTHEVVLALVHCADRRSSHRRQPDESPTHDLRTPATTPTDPHNQENPWTPLRRFTRTTRNRLEIADLLESLEPEDWDALTLCEGWTVRHMAAHLVQPMLVGFGRFFLVALRYRGSTPATVDHFTRDIARREPSELVALLRRHAGDRVDPPRVGPMGPFAETCIHLRDIARPLNLTANARQEDWVDLLTYLTAPGAAPSLTTPERIAGLTLVATDADWQYGSGPEIAGTLEALTMAVTGRRHALDDVAGPGVARLRALIQR